MKKLSPSKLKKKLWVEFSKFIRRRDSWTCVTCGTVGSGSGIHAGHYITKAVGGLALYFLETNVHAQCYRCNIHLSGNWTAYREFIIKKYGVEKEEEMQRLKHTIVKDYPFETELARYKELNG